MMLKNISPFFLFFLFWISIANAQYTNPSKQKSNKINSKTKELKENSVGDEGIHKSYKNKPARKEAKEDSKSVDITPAAVKKKAADMKKNASGDESVPSKQKNNNSESPPKILFLNHTDVKKKAEDMKLNSTGDEKVLPKDKHNNLESPPKILFIDQTKEKLRNQALEMKDNATGDLVDKHPNGLYRNISRGIKTMEITNNNQVELRKQNGRMNATSSGDINESVWKGKLSKRKNNGILAGSNSGNINESILDDRKRKMKSSDAEVGSNQGDRVNGYMIKKSREEQNSKIQASFQGKIIARASMAKEKSQQMSFSQGDIIGSYIEKLNKEKSKSEQIKNYSGTINLLKINADVKENSHKQAISMGDIATKSREAKNNIMRSRMKKMTEYKGEILVTTRSKGSHPSAVYISGRTSKSLAEREKLRKNAIKKAKRNRSIEDPAYMKKTEPRPRFETEEYKIWEGKSR